MARRERRRPSPLSSPGFRGSSQDIDDCYLPETVRLDEPAADFTQRGRALEARQKRGSAIQVIGPAHVLKNIGNIPKFQPAHGDVGIHSL